MDPENPFVTLGYLLRRMEDAVAHIVLDAAGVITTWRAAAEALFGWTAEEALGQSLSCLVVPPELQDAHRRGIARWNAMEPSTTVAYHRLNTWAVHKDGTQLPVQVTVQIIFDDTGARFLGWVVPRTLETAEAPPCG